MKIALYQNQYKVAKELLGRDPNKHDGCILTHKDFEYYASNLESFLAVVEPSDFSLLNYSSDAELKVEMLAPKNC